MASYGFYGFGLFPERLAQHHASVMARLGTWPSAGYWWTPASRAAASAAPDRWSQRMPCPGSQDFVWRKWRRGRIPHQSV